MSSDDAKVAVTSRFAETALSEMQGDISRGRYLAQATTEELAAEWVGLMRKWAADPLSSEHAHDTRRTDIEAEYKLRQEKPPFELVTSEADIISAASAGFLENMDEDAKAELNADIMGQAPRRRRSRTRSRVTSRSLRRLGDLYPH
jgi:hypothetical protein